MPKGNATPTPERRRAPPAGNSPSLIPISSFTAILVKQVNRVHNGNRFRRGKGPAALVHAPPGTFPGSSTGPQGTAVRLLLVTISGKEEQALASVSSSFKIWGEQEAQKPPEAALQETQSVLHAKGWGCKRYKNPSFFVATHH